MLLNKAKQKGITLIELIVTLVILSILAVAALPYAELSVKRNKEIELRRSLRIIRMAIDDFHEDWKTGKIPKTSDVASDDGYPRTLSILTEGVDLATATGKRKKYLRRILPNPFVEQSMFSEQQWFLRSYQDEIDATSWGEQDVYDIRYNSTKKALDGSQYADW